MSFGGNFHKTILPKQISVRLTKGLKKADYQLLKLALQIIMKQMYPNIFLKTNILTKFLVLNCKADKIYEIIF